MNKSPQLDRSINRSKKLTPPAKIDALEFYDDPSVTASATLNDQDLAKPSFPEPAYVEGWRNATPAPPKDPERHLTFASEGGSNGGTPGIFALIAVWKKWREEGRPELAGLAEALDSSHHFSTQHAKWPEVVDAVVAEWEVMGKYFMLAQRALEHFKRDGTFQGAVAQLRTQNPSKDRVWCEKRATMALTNWETLNRAQRLAFFELMLDPNCALTEPRNGFQPSEPLRPRTS
jgi:hypothetical protein